MMLVRDSNFKVCQVQGLIGLFLDSFDESFEYPWAYGIMLVPLTDRTGMSGTFFYH